MRKNVFGKPEDCNQVLLHACCAPCSSAIVEWLVQHDVRPTIFYYNPNIWPREEYEIRKNESKRHAESLGLTWIDGDYDHDQWRQDVCGLEDEPERGKRCEQCFTLRLTVAARKAKELGLEPWLLLNMRLGEGSGCPLAFQVMDAACAIMNEMATFAEASINDDYLEEIRAGESFKV